MQTFDFTAQTFVHFLNYIVNYISRWNKLIIIKSIFESIKNTQYENTFFTPASITFYCA
jgi:hypothetical protein